jgi:hypothetical protein
MGIEPSRSDNAVLSSNHISAGTYDEVRIHSIHDIRIASFANSHDDSVFNTDICLVYPSPVDDECIRDDRVQGVFVRNSTSLTHTFSQGLPTTK